MNERSRWMYGWNWDLRKIDIIKRSEAKQQFRVIHSNSILKPFNSVEFHLLNLECLSTRANIFSFDSIYFEICIDSHCWRHIISNVNSTILMCFLETSIYTHTYLLRHKFTWVPSKLLQRKLSGFCTGWTLEQTMKWWITFIEYNCKITSQLTFVRWMWFVEWAEFPAGNLLFYPLGAENSPYANYQRTQLTNQMPFVCLANWKYFL